MTVLPIQTTNIFSNSNISFSYCVEPLNGASLSLMPTMPIMPSLPMQSLPIFGGFVTGTPTFSSTNGLQAQAYSSQYSSSSHMSSVITEEDRKNSELKPGLFKGRLQGQEALVSRLCKKYGVSPSLVASIIGLESGYGTSALASHNNFMGYRAAGDLGKNEKGFGYFSSIEKGLEAAIKNLSKYTRFSDVKSVDFNNIDAIGKHYCEGGLWAGKVSAVYNSVVKKYVA